MADETPRVEALRDELAATLDEIGYRISPKHQAAQLAARIRRNPTPWVIGGVAVVAAIVGAVWAVAKRRH